MKEEGHRVSTLMFTHTSLVREASHYQGGGIALRLNEWSSLTDDHELLTIIAQGLKLRFAETPRDRDPLQYPVGVQEQNFINSEIQDLLAKKVIEHTTIQKGDYFSPIFIRKNKDDSQRIILNLKALNANIDTDHFKMESIKDVLNMITPGCYLASVDLKKAFYTVPVYEQHQK